MKRYLPTSSENIPEKVLADYAPLALSMVGDSVHTLFLRAYFSELNPYKNAKIHLEASKFACAPSQAEDAKIMLPLLTEQEKRIFNKAKNAKINTVPKHASFYEYQLATAFEAVTGYLYLSGQNDRLACLYDAIYENKLSENNNSDTENHNNPNS